MIKKFTYPLLSSAFSKSDIICGSKVLSSKYITMSKITKYFEKQFNTEICIIRTMPNLPASIGKGVTCLFKNKNVIVMISGGNIDYEFFSSIVKENQ